MLAIYNSMDVGAPTMTSLIILAVAFLATSPSYCTIDYITLHKKQIPPFRAYNFISRKSNGSTKGYNTVLTSSSVYGEEPLEFGHTYTFDMPLLAEKNVNGTSVGKVRGTYTFVDQVGGGVVFVAETFVVENWQPSSIHSPLNGTFSAVGLEYIGLNSTKPIVGGTDDFTLATGIAITHPLASDTGSVYDEYGNLFLWFMYDFVFA